jgi:hypothetical protein
MNQHAFSSAPWPSSTYSDMQFNHPSYFQPPPRTPNPSTTPNLSQEPSNMMYMPSYDPSFQQPNNTIAFPATTPPLPTPQSNRAQESPHPMYRSSTTQLTYSRPKLSTTIWEDEGTVCYQVDAKGICVARRQGRLIIFLFLLQKKKIIRTLNQYGVTGIRTIDPKNSLGSSRIRLATPNIIITSLFINHVFHPLQIMIWSMAPNYLMWLVCLEVNATVSSKMKKVESWSK